MSWLKYSFTAEHAFELETLLQPKSEVGDDVSPVQCKPWLEGRMRGLLLRFPYRLTLAVETDQSGEVRFKYGDREQCEPQAVASMFAPGHFGLSTGCKLRTPSGVNTYVTPLPESYTPLACPISAVIETWWYPKPLFLVFKVPEKGESFRFNHGTPLCRLMPLLNDNDEADILSKEEIEELARVELAYENYRSNHPKLQWVSKSGFTFSKSYRFFSKYLAK